MFAIFYEPRGSGFGFVTGYIETQEENPDFELPFVLYTNLPEVFRDNHISYINLETKEITFEQLPPKPESAEDKLTRIEQEKAELEQRLQATESAILFLLDM